MRAPFRLERRLRQPRSVSWLVPLGSVLVALVLGAILLALTDKDVVGTYQRIAERGFGSTRAWRYTLISATPLAFTGLCAAAAFRMGVINIGGEGQLYVGAIGAAFVGIAMGGQPTGVVMVAMILAGMVLGGLYAGIVGVLRARFNTNEIITSLMLNYIAAIMLNHLILNSRSYWRNPNRMGPPDGKAIDARSEWPRFELFGVQVASGFFLALVAAGVLWVLYRRTRFGFEVSVIADSPRAARFAGIRIRSSIVAVTMLSGAFAGLGGASDVGDYSHMLDVRGLQQAGYGYTGIVVAALARTNPLAVVPVAVLIGGITNAGRALQGPDFPSGLVGTLQGLFLFTAVASEVLVRYRIRRTTPAPTAAAVTSAGTSTGTGASGGTVGGTAPR